MMHVLVATDLSEAGVLSIEALVGCSAELIDSVTLLHVIDLDQYTAGGSIPQIAEWADEHLGAAAARLRDMGFACDHRVERGPAGETITRVTAEIGADLVIVGSVGKDAGSGRRIGRTAAQVAASSPAPVLIDVAERRQGTWCRVAAALPFARVLVGAEPGDSLPRLLEAVRQLPGVQTVRIVHALASGDADGSTIDTLRDAADAAGLRSAEVALLHGDSTEALLDESRSWSADVIVLARPRRNVLSALLARDPAGRIIAAAVVPVVVA